MGVLLHLSNCPSINKIDKIPEYVGQFRKEWLYIRGINKEFKYFVDNIDEASRGLFQNHRVDRIKKFIKRFLLAQERGRIQDTKKFVLKRYDVDNIIDIDKNLNNFCLYIQYQKYYIEEGEEYINPYPGMDDIYEVFKIFFSKFKIMDEKKVINSGSDSEIDNDNDSDSDSDGDGDGFDSDVNFILFNSDSDSE